MHFIFFSYILFLNYIYKNFSQNMLTIASLVCRRTALFINSLWLSFVEYGSGKITLRMFLTLLIRQFWCFLTFNIAGCLAFSCPFDKKSSWQVVRGNFEQFLQELSDVLVCATGFYRFVREFKIIICWQSNGITMGEQFQ